MTPAEKVISRSILDERTGCLVWQGSVSGTTGYMRVDKIGKPVPRIVFEAVYGDVGDSVVRHTCGNSLCVNIDHLYGVITGLKKSLPEKLAFLSTHDETSGCTLWTGSVWGGYGVFKHKGASLKAHRVAYELAHGELPAGMVVCHRCDQPLCINPDHLFIGTQKENIQDMVHKGRGPNRHGARNGRAVLTEDDVRYIRQSTETQASMAVRFGVTQAVISKAKLGQTWSSI